MEIIKDLKPVLRKYKFTHWNCCEFTAIEDEFKWVVGKYKVSLSKFLWGGGIIDMHI